VLFSGSDAHIESLVALVERLIPDAIEPCRFFLGPPDCHTRLHSALLDVRRSFHSSLASGASGASGGAAAKGGSWLGLLWGWIVVAFVAYFVVGVIEGFAQSRHDELQNKIPLIGKYKVPHFDSKASATNYMRTNLHPTTYLYTCFYMENFWSFRMLNRVDDSNYAIALPMNGKEMDMVSTRDIGRAAVIAFKNPEKYRNQDFRVVSDRLPVKKIAASLENALGGKIKVHANEPTWDQFGAFGFPGAQDMANMFHYFSEYADVWATYHRVPNHEDFDGFLARNQKTLADYVAATNAAAKPAA